MPREPRSWSAAAAAALAAALALGGCDLAPPYVAPPQSAPPAFKEAGPFAPASPADAAPRGDWWTAFEDPDLDRLEALVPTANPSLSAALAAYDQARAFAAQAEAQGLPSFSIFDSNLYNRQSNNRPLRGANQPDVYAANTFGGQAGYEFDFWGQVRNTVAAGEALAQAGAANLASARLSLEADLADTYLALRGLDAQIGLLDDTIRAYTRALELTQTRHTGGVASGLDVDRAQNQLSSAQAELSDLRAQRALYEHALASLVGQPAGAFSLPPKREPPAFPAIPAGLPSELLQRRPDIAAAERRAFAANRQIGVARAAFFPNVSLDSNGGWQNTGGDNLLSLPNTFWTIGPSITWPVFEGGALRARLRAARAGFELASANYRATVLNAFQEVEDQLALTGRLAEAAAAESTAVKAAEASANLSLIRYREGATNYLDVVTAQTAALTADQDLIRLQTRRRQAAVNLVRALGGGWSRTELPRLSSVASAKAPAATAAATP